MNFINVNTGFSLHYLDRNDFKKLQIIVKLH